MHSCLSDICRSLGHRLCVYVQLGHGHFHDEGLLMLVETIRHERIVSVAAGRAHSVALAADGKIFTWGDASRGQLGHAQLAAMMQVGRCVCVHACIWACAARLGCGYSSRAAVGTYSSQKDFEPDLALGMSLVLPAGPQPAATVHPLPASHPVAGAGAAQTAGARHRHCWRRRPLHGSHSGWRAAGLWLQQAWAGGPSPVLQAVCAPCVQTVCSVGAMCRGSTPAFLL